MRPRQTENLNRDRIGTGDQSAVEEEHENGRDTVPAPLGVWNCKTCKEPHEHWLKCMSATCNVPVRIRKGTCKDLKYDLTNLKWVGCGKSRMTRCGPRDDLRESMFVSQPSGRTMRMITRIV